ncbi:MAG TPA: DNA polymerase/3'-5' exonuclease PolX [Tepidisphaeraceae bacterium]|nr:DNA polymerase/3'-5' exonuclease PolX [Tepidisphaeraceae bacterium]
MSLNPELADLFANLAALMELRGENTFKVIAFQKVSRIIRESNLDLKKCMEQKTLCDVEGIGKASQQIIEEYINTGKSTVFDEVAASVPAGLIPLLHIEGLGPKTINLLWKERDITSLEALEKAVTGGALAGIKGIGPKKIETIRAGIESYKTRAADGPVNRRAGIMEALVPAEDLIERVRALPGVIRAEMAGSLRRRRETIADIDFVGAVRDMASAEAIMAQFARLPGVVQTIVTGPSKTSVKIANGMQVDLRLVPEENFGAALLYFTGSKDHNVKIRGLALKKKMTLSEWGLYDLEAYEKAKKEVAKPPPLMPLASRTEEDVYAKLGLAFVPPEMREDRGEVEAAAGSRLPTLITRADIRGDLHAHTNESDGAATIEQMAWAAKELGYEYLAITDHSKALAMTNGLSVERLLKHIETVHRISDKLKGITLLAGSEVDILADGRMDYDDDVLKELDIVVASPHLSLKQDARKATDRLIRAIENRYVTIIGHPTGRLINRREGLPLEMDKVIKAAADTGTCLEINASYPRLDLDEFNARAAMEAGVMISIDTDAHSTQEFDLIPYGISVARRAWLTPKHVLNAQPLAAVRKFIKAKRG